MINPIAIANSIIPPKLTKLKCTCSKYLGRAIARTGAHIYAIALARPTIAKGNAGFGDIGIA